MKQLLARRGAVEVVKRVLRRLGTVAYSRKRCYLLERDLSVPVKPFRMRMTLEYRKATDADMQLVDYVSAKRKKAFSRNLSDGSLCYGAFSDGRMVVFVFAAFKPTMETDTGYLAPVEDGQVYQYDGEVDPPHRGKAVAVAFMEWFWPEMARLGARTTLACIDPENRASLRFHKRLDFKPVRVIERTRILGVSIRRIVREWNPESDSF